MTAPRDLDPATLRYLADQYVERAKLEAWTAANVRRHEGETLEDFEAFVMRAENSARGWRNEAKRLRNLATRAETRAGR